MFKFRFGVLTAAVMVAVVAPALALQSPAPPTEATSPARASAHIQAPRNNEIVTSPFKVQIAPAALGEQAMAGRKVLLIDTPLHDQDMTRPIKADAQHIPFRKDQIAALVTLRPGPHTLQFVLADADDIAVKPPVQSEIITITVKDWGGKAAEAQRAVDAKQAQEKDTQLAKEAQAARQAREASDAQEAKATQAERALAAKEAQQLIDAMEARKALEAQRALDAKQALDTKQALDAKRALEAEQALRARLAKEDEEARLALARQAREAQRANEARKAEDARRAPPTRKATAHLRVKHAKARRTRLAMAHPKPLRPPLVLHPAFQDIQWPAGLDEQGYEQGYQLRAYAPTDREHPTHAHSPRHHQAQVHHHKRQRHHGHHDCHRG